MRVALRRGRLPGAALVAACALLLAGAALAREHEIKPGKARWAIMTSVLPAVDLDRGMPIPYADFLRLPDPPGARKKNPHYSRRLYPAAPGAPAEGTIVSVEGWLQLVAQESDGDYHVPISARPEDGNNCIIVEVPKDEPGFEQDPALRARATEVRARIRSVLPHGAEPPDRGVLVQRRTRVRVTGQLFFDDAHVGDAPRGKRHMHAATLWEVHPVTAVEVFPQ